VGGSEGDLRERGGLQTLLLCGGEGDCAGDACEELSIGLHCGGGGSRRKERYGFVSEILHR